MADRGAAVPPALGRMGLVLVLVSLSMLFAAALVAYAVVRLGAPQWPPPGSAPLPDALWLSTMVLVLSSFTMARAVRGIRRGDGPSLRRGLTATLALGLVFLVLQVAGWWVLTAARLGTVSTLYEFTFLLLAGLHAIHVAGGLVPLSVVTIRAWSGRYSASSHAGVAYTATYWHYLDAVWLVVFAVLLLR